VVASGRAIHPAPPSPYRGRFGEKLPASADLFDSSTIIALETHLFPVTSNDFDDLSGESGGFINGAFLSGETIFLKYSR
jgi:hypothetical protein